MPGVSFSLSQFVVAIERRLSGRQVQLGKLAIMFRQNWKDGTASVGNVCISYKACESAHVETRSRRFLTIAGGHACSECQQYCVSEEYPPPHSRIDLVIVEKTIRDSESASDARSIATLQPCGGTPGQLSGSPQLFDSCDRPDVRHTLGTRCQHRLGSLV